ncbi:hypothetical protein HPP92_012592 [Vanilla planifolia]|uniref:Uncharacterized protein n=1 Tax=Vanilla planifolia TaxID=51239 RepID=A0A835QP62_VANPL|nr:hypothetical protein HPP92_013005 [Vanilla planifolia]KAG0477873.1 hypothetical protein HPP92_012592 [Vanilla planifolia]
MSIRVAFRSFMRPLSARRLLPFSGRSPDAGALLSQAEHSQFFRTPIVCSWPLGTSWKEFFSTSTGGAAFQGLTDNRFPKRRPGTKPKRKRASFKPPGPHAWIQYVPGEPIPSSRPNEGSVTGRKRRKRIMQRKAFILTEKKKKQEEWKVAKRKKRMERIERKMAAVAREKAWAERLKELQQIDAQKKAAMSS